MVVALFIVCLFRVCVLRAVAFLWNACFVAIIWFYRSFNSDGFFFFRKKPVWERLLTIHLLYSIYPAIQDYDCGRSVPGRQCWFCQGTCLIAIDQPSKLHVWKRKSACIGHYSTKFGHSVTFTAFCGLNTLPF